MVDRIERNKDLIQELVESTANHVGQIATIITGAVAGVAREVGEIFTDGFEMREAARKAKLDEERILDADLVDEIVDADPADAELEDAELADLEDDDIEDEPLNIEASIEAPVVPQELDSPEIDTDDSGDIHDVTLEGAMEAPVAPE